MLIELGFISNDSDRSRIKSKKDEIATEITEGIVNFVQANKSIFNK